MTDKELLAWQELLKFCEEKGIEHFNKIIRFKELNFYYDGTILTDFGNVICYNRTPKQIKAIITNLL